MSIPIHQTGIIFRPDSKRVLVRPFMSSDPVKLNNMYRRAMELTDEQVREQLDFLRKEFGSRHTDLERCWRRHYQIGRVHLDEEPSSDERALYMGALFSGEYALESAALFNPSIVPHPDQSGLEDGALRFILSLRAIGEGHISSIEFRSGVIAPDGRTVTIDPISPYVVTPDLRENPTYHKSIFVNKLREMGFENRWSQKIMDPLGDLFTHEQMEHSSRQVLGSGKARPREFFRTMECVEWLALSNYEIHFDPSIPLSQQIIFPLSPNESNGIEDARFVRFVEDDGSAAYYATYTAYNGRAILPQLIETLDFRNFRVLTLNGQAAQNKGMALFPRRVHGNFAMISRQDDENLYLMFSDNMHFWNEPRLLQTPRMPWETVKIGNCGSPIETEHGWLVLTHGVGAMRRYCVGGILLDREDPGRVIAALDRPLLEPDGDTREGYVPNVVYSCGALIHRDTLTLPYALSDTCSTIATVPVRELIEGMTWF